MQCFFPLEFSLKTSFTIAQAMIKYDEKRLLNICTKWKEQKAKFNTQKEKLQKKSI